MGGAPEQDERPIGQLLRSRLVQASAADITSKTLRVQETVEFVGAGRICVGEEAPVVIVPALGARPVSGGEGGRFVQKEEPGVTAGRHRLAPTSPELEPARDPAAAIVGPPDPPILPVKPAAVAEDESSLTRLDQLSERRNTVLERHQTFLKQSHNGSPRRPSSAVGGAGGRRGNAAGISLPEAAAGLRASARSAVR